jgi:lipopolysaccharide transport system permease protein
MPLVLACIMLLALGVGTLLAALNVAFRDFRYVIPFMIQIWMLGTPTIYMNPAATHINGKIQFLMHLNPMTTLIGMFRDVCLGNAIEWRQFTIAAVVAVGMFILGCFYFRRMEKSFADLI